MNRTGEPNAQATALRDAVRQRVDVQWEKFAEAHPQLAAVIDRLDLVEAAVDSLRDDPAYERAMEAAARDEMLLSAATGLIARIDQWIGRILSL